MEEEKPNNRIRENIPTIHTYSSDMADAVRTNEVSVIKIALAEQKKHEQEALYKEAEGTPISKVLLLFGTLLIIALGAGGIYYLMKKKEVENTPETITKNIEALISYDNQAFLDMTAATSATDASGIINTELKKTASSGLIKAMFLTKNVDGKMELLPVEDFLSLMKVTAPSAFIRSLDAPYMVGSYQSGEVGATPHLFLLFQTKDYNQSYAGMLSWEKTLLDDLFGLFRIDVSESRVALFEKPWRDIIIDNKDARILYDVRGNEVLYYIFVTKENFIIADNQETIKEVWGRLLTKKIKPL